MVSFQSDRTEVAATSAQVASFFDDMNNFRHIMPEQVEDWRSDQLSCSFFIKNLGNLGMKKSSTENPGSIEFLSSEASKVKFTLIFHYKKSSESSLECGFEILSEMNSFVEMMAKRPLTNFVNLLTTNLKQHFSA